jgi:two-component system phosphate regulon sensor histidine kinase PhoR
MKFNYSPKSGPTVFIAILCLIFMFVLDQVRKAIEPDSLFLIPVIFLFFTSFFFLVYISFKSLVLKLWSGIIMPRKLTLSNNFKSRDAAQMEMPLITPEIINVYRTKRLSEQEILSNNEKLIHHLTMLEEGIAIFTKDKKVIINNNHFIQYINHISDKLVNDAENFFTISDFSPLVSFFNKYVVSNFSEPLIPLSYEIYVIKNNKYFKVKCIIYQDSSFEVIIRDTTKLSKQKILKQQITGNIAHELKTPVSSISGFLETVLSNKMEKTKMLEFIHKAYLQTCRLTDLINDIAILTKIEEAGKLYPVENINLKHIIANVLDDFNSKIIDNHVNTVLNIPDEIEISGNQILIYSIFRNLVENTLNHGGKDIEMGIHMYLDFHDHYYFSFYNSGKGVPEQDMPRLFERFYRVDKGRERISGGTGLGLSIVKNAILFHNGDISVKNRKEGGLEFLFSLGKDRNTRTMASVPDLA